MQQKTWLCGSCEHEWVTGYGWSPDHGCAVCGSPLIQQVEYSAGFPATPIPDDLRALYLSALKAGVTLPSGVPSKQLGENDRQYLSRLGDTTQTPMTLLEQT